MKKTKTNKISLMVVIFFAAAISVSAQDPRFIGGAGITVFADANFRGTTQTFQYDVPDLRSSGLDNKISSIRVGGGEQWEVCENRNYGGRCIVVSGQESDLRRNGWGDRISSLRRSGGGGWNPGNPGGGQRPPSWAVGTFYGNNPDNGSTITLIVENGGRVTANMNGSMRYGTLRGDTLDMGDAQSRVTRIGNGIRTVNTNNGQAIDYYRNNNGGWNPGFPGGGQRPPSWAIGTFYGSNPQNGQQITLTISNDGNVTANIGGSSTYGTIRGNVMTIDGATSRLTRQGDGFLTVRDGNGLQIYYSRSGGGWNPNPGWGNKGDVPSWAVGEFLSLRRPNGESLRLRITGDGDLTVSFNGGTDEYGTIYRDQLTFRGATSRIERISNGIRTIRNDNGERIDYRRQR
jgi:hypothetical protein